MLQHLLPLNMKKNSDDDKEESQQTKKQDGPSLMCDAFNKIFIRHSHNDQRPRH